MKVLFVDSVHPLMLNILRNKGIICDEKYDFTYADALENINNYKGLVIRSRFSVDANLIDRAENLVFIARAGSGMENINVGYAQNKGIACINSPEGNSSPVGEHAIAMLLSVLHNINKADKEVRNNEWNRISK